jgi:hypothetical protein
MGERILDPKREKRVKRGMWVLIVGGIVIVLLTIFQYPKYLAVPFAKYGQEKGLWKSTLEQDVEKAEALKVKDTDGDGLTDYDEMYVYGTSAYLADSDSDGFSDKQEIDSGNDPNCPSGQTCPKIEGGTASSAVPSSGNVGGAAAAGGAGGLLSGQATAEEVRNALRQAGMSDEALNKLDDKTLLELYTEALKENGTVPGGANVNANINTNTSAAANPNLTAAQLREILKNNGIDEATLKNIDDETLIKIYQESLKY